MRIRIFLRICSHLTGGDAVPKTVALGLDVTVAVEERDGYFAATTKPFAITVYDDTEMGA